MKEKGQNPRQATSGNVAHEQCMCQAVFALGLPHATFDRPRIIRHRGTVEGGSWHEIVYRTSVPLHVAKLQSGAYFSVYAAAKREFTLMYLSSF